MIEWAAELSDFRVYFSHPSWKGFSAPWVWRASWSLGMVLSKGPGWLGVSCIVGRWPDQWFGGWYGYPRPWPSQPTPACVFAGITLVTQAGLSSKWRSSPSLMILVAAAASQWSDLHFVNGSFKNVIEWEGLLKIFLWPGYTPEDWTWLMHCNETVSLCERQIPLENPRT